MQTYSSISGSVRAKTKGSKHEDYENAPPMLSTPYPIFRSGLGTCPISVYFPPVRWTAHAPKSSLAKKGL